MKRIYPVVMLFLMLFLLIACGPEQPETEPTAVSPTEAAPTTAPAENDISPRPTVTASSESAPMDDGLEGYPVMAVTAVPSEYPVIDYSTLPTRNPYPAPGEYIWMSVPMGEQCAESMTYPTIQDAVWVLQGEGIGVFGQQSEQLNVCTACGCPTSTHYAMQILATDQDAAGELGWQLSEEQQ